MIRKFTVLLTGTIPEIPSSWTAWLIWSQFLLFTDIIHQNEKEVVLPPSFVESFFLEKNITTYLKIHFPSPFYPYRILQSEWFIIFMNTLLSLRGDELLQIFSKSIIKLVLSAPWCCMLNFNMMSVTAETSETQVKRWHGTCDRL